jgi:recombination protein RecA
MQEVALESAIDSIRVRFGSHALARAAELPPRQPWPSQTPIDRLTGIGGLPRGRLALFTGSGTSGKLTLALSLLARATHEFAHAIVIDGGSHLKGSQRTHAAGPAKPPEFVGNFDPWTLIPSYPELSALTVVRAPAPEIAGEAAASLAKAGAGFILLMSEVPEHWLAPLEAGANRSGTVIVGVVEAPGRAFAHASSLSLGFSRTGWIWERGQLVGLRMSVRCVKNRVAPPLGETELEVRYPLGTLTLAGHTPGIAQAPAPVMELSECASAAV